MQFWKNLRRTKIKLKFVSSVLIVLIISACVDKIPSTIRQAEQLGKSQYYGFRADRWSEIEDSYLAAQASCCGPDKPNNDVRALELYCKAARFGHKASMVEIGRMYSHEKVSGKASAIPFDNILAYTYFSLASEGGYTYAETMKLSLGKKLSAEDRAKADQLIKDFPNIACEVTR